ncbi:SDR family oxidoreductase [Novosphingobium sp. BL-52-GroH]|uniref:SDR family oxidoreductase n=1 Tax=Novosphingobium sp. BL-52-GroH TaxID=3349877 RepID=UPI00384D3C26
MVKVGTSERPDWPLAVIVGAGGMGMAVARRIGQDHRLLLADRNLDHAEEKAQALRGDGYDAVAFSCDVTNPAHVASLAEAASDAGPVRTLCNVVGLSPSMGDFRAVIGVNIVGATRIAEAFRPIMASGGAAIFISSMAGHMKPLTPEIQDLLDAPLEDGVIDKLEALVGEGADSSTAYLLSKTSLNRMCKRRAKDWGLRGLRLVSLSPGLIATPMGALEFEKQPMKYNLLAATPIQREGTMLEIANVVEFLASEKASFISGTDILVDGGLTGTLQHGDKA